MRAFLVAAKALPFSLEKLLGEVPNCEYSLEAVLGGSQLDIAVYETINWIKLYKSVTLS